jgi:hypothetical protein
MKKGRFWVIGLVSFLMAPHGRLVLKWESVSILFRQAPLYIVISHYH